MSSAVVEPGRVPAYREVQNGDSRVPAASGASTETPPAAIAGSIGSLSELLDELRLLRIVSGNPSFGTIARCCRRPRSTIASVVSPKRKTLPTLDLMLDFVAGCDPDADPEPWRAAWVRIACRSIALADQAFGLAAVESD